MNIFGYNNKHTNNYYKFKIVFHWRLQNVIYVHILHVLIIIKRRRRLSDGPDKPLRKHLTKCIHWINGS